VSEPTVSIALRIPGPWAGPQEFVRALPEGCRVSADQLELDDGTRCELGGVPADDQFAEIFRTSCRQPPTAEEEATVRGYKANVLLHGPGGSIEAAHAMMRLAAAVVRAGGAGVFIDNSVTAHGGENWLAMTADSGPDAVSFAFVAIVRGKAEVWTMGMHALGLPDVVMKRADVDGGFDIVEMIRYLAAGDKAIGDGHVIADLDGPRFRTSAQPDPNERPDSPLYNPFGRMRLVSMRDIAEAN
jgi:hypothetical protein